MANKEMSDELEAAMKEYSRFLVKMSGWKATEIEFEEKLIQDRLSHFGKDVRPGELPVIQLMKSLCEAHGKSAIVALGIDPFSMTPLVRMEGDELSF